MNEEKVYNLFPDPIFKCKLENYKEINKELSSYILDLQKKDSMGNTRSNRGGWHSPNFDLVNQGPPINFINNFKDFLKHIIINEFGWEYIPNKQRIVAMWAIINKKNSYNVKHNHQNCYLSSAYYVKKPKNSGDITFFDPKEAKTYRFPEIKKNTDYSVEKVSINAEEGDLLIFPSYLYHEVGKNLTDEDRIVVSFNVDIGY
tara:strand:- start:854 stop:1459 length:606 start_codon:yes stop_codon:yes gene_type:complete